MIPGEIITGDGDIELNVGRATCRVMVVNTGDRPIQVGSHYHFFETNTALQFERELAWGKRLNIAAGTAVRFEPGQRREVKLVGGKVIRDGMGQSQRTSHDVVDTVITNALILDHWGIVKADIGIKHGRIKAFGKAGNPDVQPGGDFVIGAGT